MSNLNVKMLNVCAVFGTKKMELHPVLIFDEDKAVLIDSGMLGTFEELKSEVEKYVSLDKLKGLVITHHDIDHVGTAKSFKVLLGDKIKIYSTDVEADYISGAKRPHKLEGLEANEANLDEVSRERMEFFRKGFESSFVKVDETFKAGDRLPIFNEVETLDMPGHTIGHICVYVRNQKTLITGDAVTLENGKLIKIRDGANYDPKMAIKSLEKLRNLPLEKVLCYHGGKYLGEVNVDKL
ncbi:MAG: MBL fold metallo-hydrolase [Sarcina sp.]